MIEEDKLERQRFDKVTAVFYGGEPLAAVHITLAMWATQAPPNGSHGCLLAILANEVEKARAALAAYKEQQ